MRLRPGVVGVRVLEAIDLSELRLGLVRLLRLQVERREVHLLLVIFIFVLAPPVPVSDAAREERVGGQAVRLPATGGISGEGLSNVCVFGCV